MSGERWVSWYGTTRIHWLENNQTLCGFLARDWITATPADKQQCGICRRALDAKSRAGYNAG